MKKIIKNPIFTFILGILISGVTVYAVSYNANQIDFNPDNNNWNVNKVDQALNYLYENKSGFFFFFFGKITEDSDQLNLNYTSDFNGKILLIVTHVEGKNNKTIVKKNNENIDIITGETLQDYRHIEYATIDVKKNDEISCNTNSISSNGAELVWSYSACSLFRIK